jgi:hypothetical protein
MASVQTFIRTEVSRGAPPVPKGAEAFRTYAIASANELIPEMENAARLTLDHPMTFGILGEGLRSFEGRALRDLVNFRRRCKEHLITCLDSFQLPGPLSIWVGCPETKHQQDRFLPKWLSHLLSRNQNDLKLQNFTHPLDIHSRIRGEYLEALQTHLNCKSCLMAHATFGLTFCTELEEQLALARDKVIHSLHLQSTTIFTLCCRYAVIATLSLV